jgi:hypothetical protein
MAGGARSSVDLAGFRERSKPRSAIGPVPRVPILLSRDDGPLGFELAEAHYRRSESSWSDAGSPHGVVEISANRTRLSISVAVWAGDMQFSAPDAVNALDNEHADTMAAGIQLYARTPEGAGAWMLVPESSPTVRVRPIAGWGALGAPSAEWQSIAKGYCMTIELALPKTAAEIPIDLDIIVNETVAGRERRRGQLVLSGARDEFVYLRGDRHEAARLLPFLILP